MVSLTYRILFHNFLFTYRNYRPTRTKVYHLSLRWRSWSLNDPHNEKNNMDHPSRIKTHRLPDYTGPTSAYAPLTVQRASHPIILCALYSCTVQLCTRLGTIREQNIACASVQRRVQRPLFTRTRRHRASQGEEPPMALD